MFPAFLVLTLVSVPAVLPAAEIHPGTEGSLVAHEWGTFTSVANADGSPEVWMPLAGPSDLPCFVVRFGTGNPKSLFGTIRMETPVLYFYAGLPMRLSVSVDFKQGRITEFYPRASASPTLLTPGKIAWDAVEVRPGESGPFPVEKSPSHYYAARQTDSAPLQVGSQREKLIFYRGVGDVPVPLRPVVTADGRLQVTNDGIEPISRIILFESREGKTGYRVAGPLRQSVTLDMPDRGAGLEGLLRQLEEDLVERGLYRKEALAMIETWRDSWFEDGTRLFYLASSGVVDTALLLTIQPAPSQSMRVFVGRVEILSPWRAREVEAALQSGNENALERYGRFLLPFMSQIDQQHGPIHRAEAAKQFIDRAWIRMQQPPACPQ